MIRATTLDDLPKLARNMSKEDVTEVREVAGYTPMEALALGYMHSNPCVTGIDADGNVVCMFGVTPYGDGTGAIWLLSTDAIKEHALELIREGRKWLAEQAGRYSKLMNVVHAEHITHIRLIKAMGFTLLEPIDDYMGRGVRVVPFERTL
jgi:hypothetical protein